MYKYAGTAVACIKERQKEGWKAKASWAWEPQYVEVPNLRQNDMVLHFLPVPVQYDTGTHLLQ